LQLFNNFQVICMKCMFFISLYLSLFLLSYQSFATDRAYTTRYDTLVRGGGVVVGGNSNINRTLTGISQYIDIDGDPLTFNSSSESIVIPAGAVVLKAYLYWQSVKSYSPTSFTGGFNTSVQFKTPSTGGAYTTIVPDVIDITTAGYFWQGIKEVTNLVKASGTYTVANISCEPAPPATNGYLPFGGWSLWVAYMVPTDVSGYKIVLVDGMKYVSALSNDVTLGGFKIPLNPAITLDAEAGWFVGHSNYDWGDAMTYTNNTTGTTIQYTDVLNPIYNVLNESRSYKGVPVTGTRNPATGEKYYNTPFYNPTGFQVAFPWFDLDVIDLTPMTTRGQTSFTLKFYPQGNGVSGCGNTIAGCDDWNHPGYIYARLKTGITISDPKKIEIAKPAPNSSIPLNGGINLPPLSGSGPELEPLGAGNAVRILQIPLNAELYYNFGAGPVLLSNNSLIPSLDPSMLTVKFTNVPNADSVTFRYGMISSDGMPDIVGADYTINWATSLPLSLVAFEASAMKTHIEIRWTTSKEKDVSGFDVQKSTDGIQWHSIGYLPVSADHGVPEKQYQYIDNEIGSDRLMYRLKIEDIDGTYELSSVRTVRITPGAEAGIQLSPNPTNGMLHIEAGQTVDAVIQGIDGKELLKIYNTNTVDATVLAPGLYLLRIFDPKSGQLLSVQKFSKQ
jgi:hypothetical protein